MPRKKAVKEEKPLENEAEQKVDIEQQKAEVETEATADVEMSEEELDENANDGIEDEMSQIDASNEKAEKEKGADAVDVEDEPVEEYVISNRMISLIESAIYNHERLTGMLYGVERSKVGIIANVIYNGNSDNLDFDSVTVKIAADEMGLDDKGIENHIRARARRRGVRLTPSLFEREKRRMQYGLLNNMLGAKVDFIPSELISESHIVTGSRKAAMLQKRRYIFPTSRNSMPTIGVNSRENARVIRVNAISMVVEVSGIETVMRASDVSPFAIDLTEKFKPGDNIRVIIQKITEDGITVISTASNKVDVKRRIQEYKIGSICIGDIYYHNGVTGKYFIKLPNGCRGLSYYEKSILHTNPKTGDRVRFRVTGYAPSGRVVRCRILGVM